MDLITLAMAKKYTEKRVAEISGESSSGVQADWNQNDEVAPDYIKNRPFSETINFEIMIEHGGEAKVDEYSDGAAYYLIELAENTYFNGIIGNTYVVELNGVRYETTLGNCYFGNYLGNLNLAWAVKYSNTYDGTGLPFGILFSNEIYFVVPEEGIYDLKIGILNKNIKTLDTKFLPDKYPKITYDDIAIVDNVEVAAGTKLDCVLYEDSNYTVIFDDTEYQCDTIVEYMNGFKLVYIGNPKFVNGEDNGLPFAVVFYTGDNTTTCALPSNESHTMSIIGKAETITPIHKSLVTNIVSGDYIEEFGLKETDTVDDALHKLIVDAPFTEVKTKLPISSSFMQCAAYGNGRYVFVTNERYTQSTDVIYYSNDGINWETATLPKSLFWRGMAYGNEVFVLIGTTEYNSGDATFLRSSDGINWDVSYDSKTKYSCLKFTNGKFISAKGSNKNSEPAYSIDGITWTTFNGSVNFDYDSNFIFGNDIYMRSSTTNDNNTIGVSIDNCATWKTVNIEGCRYPHICFGGDKFVCISGYEKQAAYSYDGMEWFKGDFSEDYVPNENYIDNIGNICYIDNMFVTENKYTNEFLYSKDGITWNVVRDKFLAANNKINGNYNAVFYNLYVTDNTAFTVTYDNNNQSFLFVEVKTGNLFGFAKNADIEERFATKEYVEEYVEEVVNEKLENIGGSTGGAVVSEISYNDLTDRPIYRDIVPVPESVWETTVTTAEYGQEGKTRANIDSNFISQYIRDNEKAEIYVEINGELYTTYFRGGSSGNTIGNHAVSGYGSEDTGEPFGLSEGRGGYHFTTTLGAGEYHVKMYQGAEDIKKLDMLYLPEGYPSYEYEWKPLVENYELERNYNGFDVDFNLCLKENTRYMFSFNGEEYIGKTGIKDGASNITLSIDRELYNVNFSHNIYSAINNEHLLDVNGVTRLSIWLYDSEMECSNLITIKEEVKKYNAIDEHFIPSLSEIKEKLDEASSWNDLSDKPFYDYVKLTDVLYEASQVEATLSGITGQPSDFVCGAVLEDYKNIGKSCIIDAGVKVAVEFDGKIYVVENKKKTDYITYFGNPRLLSDGRNHEDTGEPFCITHDWFSINQHNMNLYTREAGLHDVKICNYEIASKPLDEKYIPALDETYATKEEVATMAILTSPNGTKYKLAVSDDGTLSAIPVE